MIEIEIDSDMLEKAKLRAEKLGELKNSVTKGQGNIAGILGELITQKAIGGEIKDTRDFDLLLKNNETADVKTRRCSSMPEPHFDCSVSDYNTKQKCDNYIFTRVLGDYSKGWVLGWIKKEDFFKKATLVYQGQLDRESGRRAKSDTWNLAISELNSISDLEK